MPWREVSAMSLRQEFVSLALIGDAHKRELCRRFGISSRTAYKWLRRYEQEGLPGLADRSRRPLRTPEQTPLAMETAVLTLRDAHPAWGGRKIQARLLHLGHAYVPSPSTITAILHRNGRIDPEEGVKHHAWQRFEHDAPNRLWQMDFKGHFPLAVGRCHPLTVLDDHSRFAVGLQACGDEQGATVQQRLSHIFRHYGLPEQMLMDNGSPWGYDRAHPHTLLTIWLMRLGIKVSHGRPYHPQTQGKDERFHRTLTAEVLRGRHFADLGVCQSAFDQWRDIYNLERPHQALDFAPPVSRYQVSPRPFPEVLPSIEYGPDDLVRKVSTEGDISFRAHPFSIGKAFRGLPIALRPTLTDGVWNIVFLHHFIAQVDLSSPSKSTKSVYHVSEHV